MNSSVWAVQAAQDSNAEKDQVFLNNFWECFFQLFVSKILFLFLNILSSALKK